jgi:hypothetical protein
MHAEPTRSGRPRRRHDVQPACIGGGFRSRDGGGLYRRGRTRLHRGRGLWRSGSRRRRLRRLFDRLDGRRGLRVLRRPRRGRRRRRDDDPGALGQERERVDVALFLGGASDPEVHVRLAGDRVGTLTDRADARSLGDLVSSIHDEQSELQQGHGVAVARSDRQRTTATGHGPGERHGPRGRRARQLADGSTHVDPAMLTSGVRVRAERERSEHRPLDRPGPRVRSTRKQQRDQGARYDREPTHRRTSFVVSGVNDRTSNVAAASTVVMRDDANVERSLRSCYRERS